MEARVNIRLTKRENQIAGLAFCGKARKEMADILNVAIATVNIHADRAFKKTGTSKLNELGAWWANKEFNLDIDFEKLQKTIVTMLLFGIIFCQLNGDMQTTVRRTRRSRGRRRSRTEEVYIYSKSIINQAA